MDKRPLQEFPQPNEEMEGETSEQRPNLVTRWMERLAHLGLGEFTLRIGTNILVVLLIVAVVLLLQKADLGGNSSQPSASVFTPTPALPVSQLPVEISASLDGISRQAELHTTIPSRPRMEVIQYTVQANDSIFVIADKYGLKPTTILFGNYDTLKNNPDFLKVDQKLNILPVDGAYYEWQGVENLTQVATSFGVNTESITDFIGNHLDPNAIGDLSHPNIAAGTWLVIPGGKLQFSWTPPSTLVRMDPNPRLWGSGVCSGIKYVKLGSGTFVYPTVEHWLSGTPYRPDVNHFGVDFAGNEGNAVYSVDGGSVVYSGDSGHGYGNIVIVDHGNGWESRYAHLSQINVSCGQEVSQGEVIGLVGMTGGTSTGPHLHFELVNSTYGFVNPLDYLP